MWLALGWAMVAAVVWGSLTPAAPQAGNDKIGHFAVYGVLMFWFAQGRLGYRSFELYDMLANALGVLLGWAGALLLRKPLFR
jgi:hypothetical protein